MSQRADLDSFLATISEGRDGMPISIEEAQQLTGIGRPAVLKRFRLLQQDGQGFLKLGRHGHPTRFYFASGEQPGRKGAAPVREGGTAVQHHERMEDGADELPAALPRVAEAHEPSMVEHRFQLRHDLVVIVRLPCDFTSREAGRLARFVEALPF